MFRGFLVIHEGGNPIFTFFTEKGIEHREVLISGFISAIQSFASEAFLSPDGGSIQSIRLSQTLLTFKKLIVRNTNSNPFQYFFVLLTDLTKRKQSETDQVLEYLSLNFLSYKRGEFRRNLRKQNPQMADFKDFEEFIKKVIEYDWKDLGKKVKPVPDSLIQGLLNELRDYVPLDQIINLHPKIMPLGKSYAWLSDDLSKEEEENLVNKIKQTIARLFGESFFNSLIDRVNNQLLVNEIRTREGPGTSQ